MAIVTTLSGSVPRPYGTPPTWSNALKLAIRDPVELCERLELASDYHQRAIRAAARFPVLVPLEFLARIQLGDPQDPLLRQVLPLAEELEVIPGFGEDPVGDCGAAIAPRLLKKYARRVLIVTTGACAVHCRYCFRRCFPYAAAATGAADTQHAANSDLPDGSNMWESSIRELSEDPSIEEIILSGGDPLTLGDRRLELLISRIEAIRHIRRLRIHTRLPIVIPQRVTGRLLAILRKTRLTVTMVVQVNHPAELDEPTGRALSRCVDAGIPVLNQAVLLRGVNDRFEVLRELCTKLIDLRVTPYYLHQLDRVSGAAHFEVPVEEGKKMIRRLRASLPGYAVPRFVQEQPGQFNKTVLA